MVWEHPIYLFAQGELPVCVFVCVFMRERNVQGGTAQAVTNGRDPVSLCDPLTLSRLRSGLDRPGSFGQ